MGKRIFAVFILAMIATVTYAEEPVVDSIIEEPEVVIEEIAELEAVVEVEEEEEDLIIEEEEEDLIVEEESEEVEEVAVEIEDPAEEPELEVEEEEAVEDIIVEEEAEEVDEVAEQATGSQERGGHFRYKPKKSQFYDKEGLLSIYLNVDKEQWSEALKN